MMTRRSRFLAIAATSALALAAPAHADTLREALAEAYRTNSLRTAQRAHAPEDVFEALAEAGQR